MVNALIQGLHGDNEEQIYGGGDVWRQRRADLWRRGCMETTGSGFMEKGLYEPNVHELT